MKKLFLCVTAAALLAAPTFAVADPNINVPITIPIFSHGTQVGNTIYGNNNGQNGNIRSNVFIANTDLPILEQSYKEYNEFADIDLFPNNVAVSGSINVGPSASQLSVINGVTIPELDDNGDPVAPTSRLYSINTGTNNTMADAIVGNNIRVKSVVDTEELLASIEDLLVNDISFGGHWTHNHHFNGGFYSND